MKELLLNNAVQSENYQFFSKFIKFLVKIVENFVKFTKHYISLCNLITVYSILIEILNNNLLPQPDSGTPVILIHI
jgi:hypothetical protein